MGLRQKDPLLIAICAAGVLALSWGFIGTKDLEEQFNGAYSYAASYGNTVFSRAPEFGKHTYLGIPVYDTSIGMGYQIPFLYGTSHSPFILLRYIFPTQVIQFVVVVFASLFALTSLNQMYKSWSSGRSRCADLLTLALLDIGVMGPPSLYLFVNEWSTQAAQYFGGVAIASLLFDKSWFVERDIRPLQVPRIRFTIAIGIVLLFMGHQGNVPNFLVLFLIPVLAHLYSRKISWQDRRIVMLLCVILLSTVLPNLLDILTESAKQPFARITAINWYSFSFSNHGIWEFINQMYSGNSWPVRSLLQIQPSTLVDESSKGFFGLTSVVFVIIGAKFISRSRPLSVAFFILFVCIFFVGIQSLVQSRLSAFASSAAWQLRDTLLIISTLMIALFAATLQKSTARKKALKILKTGTLTSMCISALFPIAIVGIQVKNSGYSNGVFTKVIQQENTDWIEALRGAGVKEGDRVYIANPNLFRFADWLGYEKQPQFVELGVSTINGWPKIRAAFTLAKNQAGFEAKFYNVIDSRFGCRPHELAFLAVDWVIDSNGECQEVYLNEFSMENVWINKVGKNFGTDGADNVYLYRIKQTRVFGETNNKTEATNGRCALLVEDDCLESLGITSEEVGKKVFNLCVRQCVANFQWYSDIGETAMVIPLDYQSFLKIENTRTNHDLKSSSFAGLLRVEKDAQTKNGDDIKISMRPDQIMMVSVFSTWISIFVVASIGLLPLVKKYCQKNRLDNP
jgi:hypothetical protein